MNHFRLFLMIVFGPAMAALWAAGFWWKASISLWESELVIWRMRQDAKPRRGGE